MIAIATIDEVWIQGALAERRVMHGTASLRPEKPGAGGEIVAIDARDDELVERCERAIVELRAAMPRDAERVRLVARSDSEPMMTIERDGISIVTTPEFVAQDMQLLVQPPAPRPLRPAPFVWHHGSAAVLLHEAIGHPLELGIPPIAWPEWLRVDCPMEMRRASFSDVPLRRMTRVVVSQENAPFDLPEPRIDIHLIRGGAYDPLTDVVTIDVAVPRFTIRATRAQIAASLVGAVGEPIRYPGVICSREGQELFVGSFAPLLVTRGLA